MITCTQADKQPSYVGFPRVVVVFQLVQVIGEMSSGSSGCHNPEGTCMTSCLIRCGIHGNWGSGMSCTASHLITLLANSEAAGLVAHMEHVSCVQNNTSHHKHATKPGFS